MKTDQAHDFLVDFELATRKEIQLVTNINGYTLEQMENILYARTAYKSFEQYVDAEFEMEDYNFSGYGIEIEEDYE